MKRIVIAAFLAVTMLVTLPSSASHSVSGNYVASTPGFSLVWTPVPSVPVGIGGYQFLASSQLPASLTIQDGTTLNASIPVTVCQVVVDTVPSPLCGDPGTINFRTCTSSAGTVNLTGRGFVANKVISVFVESSRPAIFVGACEGVATAGQITLRYA